MRVFGVIRRRAAYRGLAYALTILPLALSYIGLIALGVAAGIALLPFLVGLPILGATVALWWWLGELERRMGAWWLGVELPPAARPQVGARRGWRGWWQTAGAYLASQRTWMTLGYLLLKLALGVPAFVLSGGLLVLAVGLLAAPLPLALAAAFGDVHPGVAAGGSMALVGAGITAWATALHTANGVTRAAAALLRLMLGQPDPAQQLAAAAALAEREHHRAERAERSRRELIVNVGHELRTPTATIRGHVESLLLGLEGEAAPPDAETLRHHLGIVERETGRLGTLIDELLTLARADAGELTIQLAPVPAAEVVEEVYQSIAPLARRQRQVTVTHGVERGVPAALADRQRLVQVLLNLVRNAVAYTPEGGIVAVTAEPGGAGKIAFSVVDTGVGIAPEELPHIFERFYRADPSRARASGGFGLGLAIVRDLVSAMGGSVEVESQMGEGTRFRVLLPAAL